ncbi:MAG: M56 family metallopeptidase [Clostridia bacterium]|nr:M56 family metallopeptidase [Clostridia bacterium]
MTLHIISVSLLALLICVLSLIFRRRVSSRIIYALWLALALRICTPWFIAVEMPIPEFDSTATEATYEDTGVSAGSIFHMATDAISIGLFIWFNASGFYFKRKLRDNRTDFCEYKGETVYLSPTVHSPCVSGVIPDIYINHHASQSPQLKMILHHEYIHTRHLDNLWTFARTVALCFFWWNPIIWLAVLLSKQDCELACDESVLSSRSKKERLNYAKMIVESASYNSSHMLGLSAGNIKERLRMMSKKSNRLLSAFICIICIVGTAFSFIVPVADSDAVYGSVPELYYEENVIKIMEDHGYMSENTMRYSLILSDGDELIKVMICLPIEHGDKPLPATISSSSQFTPERLNDIEKNNTVQVTYSANDGDNITHRICLIQLLLKCRFIDQNRITII